MKRWKQYDIILNEKAAWEKEKFPNAQYHYFKECGCFVTSIANLLIKYNLESNSFSPWTLNEKLKKIGGFSDAADLYANAIEKLYPINYCGREKYTKERALELLDKGYACILVVRGVNYPLHYVLMDSKTEVSDPNSEINEYPNDNNIYYILKYRIIETKHFCS